MNQFLKNILTVLGLFLYTTITLNAQQSDVRAAFDKYKSAMLEDKGDEAVTYVDSRTIGYYEELAKKIRNADSVAIESLTLIDKMTVLIVRLKATKEEMLSFHGKSLLQYAINNGMVGKNNIVTSSIGAVTIEKNFAKGEILSNKQKTSVYFHFYKEEGNWKINITTLFPIAESAFKKMIEDSGKSGNEFMLPLIELVTRKKAGAEIWKPLQE